MGHIYTNPEELIGHTPMLELRRLVETYRLNAKLFAKLEWMNPGGSAKDRIAVKMIDEAEKMGLLQPGRSVIIEPTSGNTGIGLAMVAALRGYETVIVMPEDMSEERKRLMTARGAKLILTDASEGIAGSIARAESLAEENPNAWIPRQFANPAGPLAHYETTGPEIWEDMEGRIDAYVCTVGTGGTITGTSRYLKEQNANLQVIAVEPMESAVLSGGNPGKHGIQGIGAGFIPKVLDTSVYDEVIAVATEDAYEMSRAVAECEGILIGISSGAAVKAAIKAAQRQEMKGKNIVVLLPDSGDRYLSSGLY